MPQEGCRDMRPSDGPTSKRLQGAKRAATARHHESHGREDYIVIVVNTRTLYRESRYLL